MKRLIRKYSRLRKRVFAEWQRVDPADPNVYEYLTDAMTNNYSVQIDYDGSGWRNIKPYGWNTSKQNSNGEGGNVLLMCYKDSGEVRSYRFDRINDIYIDYDSQMAIDNNPQMIEDEQTQIYENIVDNESENIDESYDIPLMPQDNVETSNDGIYDNQLQQFYNEGGDKIEQV